MRDGPTRPGFPKLLALTRSLATVAMCLAALWVAARGGTPAPAEAPKAARTATLAPGERPGGPDRGGHQDDLPGSLTPDDGEEPDGGGGPTPAPAVAPPRIGRPAPLPPHPVRPAAMVAPGPPRYLTLLRVRC